MYYIIIVICKANIIQLNNAIVNMYSILNR